MHLSLSATVSTLGVLLATTTYAFPDFQTTADGERIIGGVPVKGHEFPFAAVLNIVEKEGVALCGGTLISKKYILTAAHCVTEEFSGKAVKAKAVAAGLGSDDINDVTVYEADKIIVHPDYDYRKVTDDLALVKLKKSIKSSDDDIKWTGITDAKLKDGMELVAIGWGKTSNSGTVSDDLRQVDVKLGPSSDCREANPDFKDQSGSQLCAAQNDNHDTCQGDSGGPLLYKDKKGSYKIAGITSYGFTPGSDSTSCGTNSVVAFYTNADYYIKWISKETDISKSKLRGDSASDHDDDDDDDDRDDDTSTAEVTVQALTSGPLSFIVGITALVLTL
ncbi:Ovochymase-2 [Tieghemiomyces parasiticus]|uniref:Ovochymase-2 n=1 Tax=Tieghemiomyces parasiticus TaxID=78921 RepID=A0A9W8E2L5_9FUNG|nr:Ovochymase-2 [Tieghemiomyces parasiticus]